MNLYLLYALIFLVFLNLVTFFTFGVDKKRSIKGKVRLKENFLLFLALITPVGALVAMKYFKHKTRKNKFKIGVPLFLLIHILMLPVVIMIFKKIF